MITNPHHNFMRHGLIKFDISGIPAGADISSANLSIRKYSENNVINEVCRMIYLKELGAHWNDLTVLVLEIGLQYI